MLISPPGPSCTASTHVYAGDLGENHLSSLENPDDFPAGNGRWGRQVCALMVFEAALGTMS